MNNLEKMLLFMIYLLTKMFNFKFNFDYRSYFFNRQMKKMLKSNILCLYIYKSEKHILYVHLNSKYFWCHEILENLILF